MSDNGKDARILEGKASGMLFEDKWSKTYKNKALLLKELFTYSIFQASSVGLPPAAHLFEKRWGQKLFQKALRA